MSWKSAWLGALSGLSINLASGWFGAIVILPNFSPVKTLEDFWVLLYDAVFGSIFLVITVLIARNQKV
ncbi:MAG: hypothetical protein AAB800_02890 [Patescibacteria group bacterium]